MLFGIFGTLLSPNVRDKIIEYTPEGVCSRRIEVHVDGSRIRKVSFAGGCHGNTRELPALLEGGNRRGDQAFGRDRLQRERNLVSGPIGPGVASTERVMFFVRNVRPVSPLLA